MSLGNNFSSNPSDTLHTSSAVWLQRNGSVSFITCMVKDFFVKRFCNGYWRGRLRTGIRSCHF